MIRELTDKSVASVERYGVFLNILRSQADNVFRRGPTDERLRVEAEAVAAGAARSFVERETEFLSADIEEVAERAYSDAQRDLSIPQTEIPETFDEFINDSVIYVLRQFAAQAERDVVTMAKHNQMTALRIDRYVRSGRHTKSTAAAQVMIEDNNSPSFRFIDRMGRKYKASKHIRDLYRQTLLNVYNEVYCDVVSSYGHDTVFVSHPDPNYKWAGVELVIVTGLESEGMTLYYDVREEVFHPSSDATVTIKEDEDVLLK